MSKRKVISFCEQEIRGDTAELATKKGRQVFQEKIEWRHPQLPPRVSPTLVTPLSVNMSTDVGRLLLVGLHPDDDTVIDIDDLTGRNTEDS